MTFYKCKQVLFVQHLEAVQPCERTDQAAARRIPSVEAEFVINDASAVQLDPLRGIPCNKTWRVTAAKAEMPLVDAVESGDSAPRQPENFADGETGKKRTEKIFQKIFKSVCGIAVTALTEAFFKSFRH